jgi:heme-degrading monooxygenase HmoA
VAKVIVSHHVSDYDQWYPVFKEHGEVRRTHGATGHTVTRTVEDPNQLVVVNEFATVEGAQAFMADPSLADAMQRAGVDGEPTIYLVDEVEDVRY